MRKNAATRDPKRSEAAALRAWERCCSRLALRLPAAGAARSERPRRLHPLGGSRWRIPG